MKLIHSVSRSFRWSVNSIVQRLRHCIAAQPQHNDRWAVCDQGRRARRRQPMAAAPANRSRRSSPIVFTAILHQLCAPALCHGPTEPVPCKQPGGPWQRTKA